MEEIKNEVNEVNEVSVSEEKENEENEESEIRNERKSYKRNNKKGRINGMYNWRIGWRYSVIRQRNGENFLKPNIIEDNNIYNNIEGISNNLPLQYEKAWKWWKEVCGSPKYILAPMIGQSDLCFRLLCREVGNVNLCYTQMYEAININSGLHDNELICECPLPYLDRPLICQIAGCDTEEMIKASLRIQNYFDAIDINLGCPQRCADLGNYGSFLPERNLDNLLSMLTQLTQTISIPITVKIRLLSNHNIEENINYVLKLQETGIYAICIHSRTRHDKEYEMPANWNMLRILKSILKIPVISNGSIVAYEDIESCFSYTKVDAIMSGTGLLRNPSLFLSPSKYLQFESSNSENNEENQSLSLLYTNTSYIRHILLIATKYLHLIENVSKINSKIEVDELMVNVIRSHLFSML